MSGLGISRQKRRRYAPVPREQRLSVPIVGRMLQASCKPVVSLFEASVIIATNGPREEKPGVFEETEGPAQELKRSYASRHPAQPVPLSMIAPVGQTSAA